MSSSPELLSQSTFLKSELQALHEKASEFEMEREETRIVMKALREMSPSRPCYRQISGVLVEGTVEAMIPHLELQESNLNTIISQLEQQIVSKATQLQEVQKQISSASNQP
ncbi:Prefoldin subunit 2 [Mitosporidium daphniae]